MGDMHNKKLIEKFDEDFHKISSKEAWEPCDISLMKDLQKLMYYMEVRDAMKDGGEYPGSDYMDERGYGYGYGDYDMSYRRGRDSMGRFTSGDYGYGNRGGYGRSYDRGYNRVPGNRYYDGNMGGGSGRRYYDSDKDTTMEYLHRMMDSESRPEMKNAMQMIAQELERK